MSDERTGNGTPLLQRVDALLRSHGTPLAQGDPDVPVLTDIVDVDPDAPVRVDPEKVEALARELERAVLARLGEELDRAIDQRLAGLLEQTIEGVRADLTAKLRQMVREAVTASVESALKSHNGTSAGRGSG